MTAQQPLGDGEDPAPVEQEMESQDGHESDGGPVMEVQPVVAAEAEELLLTAGEAAGRAAAADGALGEGEPEDEAGADLEEEGQESGQCSPVEERGSAHVGSFVLPRASRARLDKTGRRCYYTAESKESL